MKNKIAVLSAAALLIFAALAGLGLVSGQKGYDNLLLMTPARLGAPAPDVQKLEELCEDEFLATYEIKREETVLAANSRHTVTLVGTNSRYRDVMGYPLTDGGFFTQSAWENKSKTAVLNETAASRLFGSFNISGQAMRIKGETWVVAGVMRDGDEENANMYAPSSVTGGRPLSLIALMDAKITEAYVKNALKGLNIHDGDYAFVNLAKTSHAFYGRFTVAWKLALGMALILLARIGYLWIASRLSAYKQSLKEMYLKELLAKNRTNVIKTVLTAVLSVAGCAAALALSAQILAACLAWRDLQPVSAGLPVSDFETALKWLKDFHAAGIALFAVFCTDATVLFACIWALLPRRFGASR